MKQALIIVNAATAQRIALESNPILGAEKVFNRASGQYFEFLHKAAKAAGLDLALSFTTPTDSLYSVFDGDAESLEVIRQFMESVADFWDWLVPPRTTK